MEILSSVTIEKPKKCGDCFCYNNDSDYGGTCGYTRDSTRENTEVTIEGLKDQNCLFKTNFEF